MIAAVATIAISLAGVIGMLVRPWRTPEAVWPCTAALMLVAFRLMPVSAALAGIERGADVYAFLTGMMLLAEMARREGLFDWLAGHATKWSGGSSARLFTLVFAMGVVVTTFLSNDATAVVMTPAVFAAARKAKVDPAPTLFACALVANAASFVLPISNPANLVLYGHDLPRLGRWLGAFALPSLLSIGTTYGALRWTMRGALRGHCGTAKAEGLPGGARIVLGGIGATAILLLVLSALGRPLGVATALAGGIVTAILMMRDRRAVVASLRNISWSVLPLVAGLFVLVEAMTRLGTAGALARMLGSGAAMAGAAGVAVAIASNLMNNLPAGLIASAALGQAHAGRLVTDAALIGVDLGPNLSITGSLATILWLATIRREGGDLRYRQFLKVGVVVMPPALCLALAARIAIG